MALADYYRRSAVAVAQVLSGFDEDAIRERLERCVLDIVVSADAGRLPEGRYTMDLVLRLTARLYPTIRIEAPSRLSREMTDLAHRINPTIETDPHRKATHSIVIGPRAIAPSGTAFYVGSNGWDAFVSRRQPQRVGKTRNPFGPGASACFGVAALFRHVFGQRSAAEPDVAFRALPRQLGGNQSASAATRGAVLVGAGAVGHGLIWALSKLRTGGVIHLVDPEDLDLGNLQRYVMAERDDVGQAKVQILRRHLAGADAYRGTWASFVAQYGSKHQLVLSAVDSATVRQAIQASLPETVINGWTQPGDLGVATHNFDGAGACLYCLYLPQDQAKNEDAIYAEALGIPEQVGVVRTLLFSGQAVPDQLLNLVADRLGVSHEAVQPFSGRPIRELYREGVCGGAVLPIGRTGTPRADVHVPLAHQSALAGVLMAARVFATRTSRTTLVTRLDLMHPAHSKFATQAAAKDPRGICICQDADYQTAYRTKYRGASRTMRKH